MSDFLGGGAFGLKAKSTEMARLRIDSQSVFAETDQLPNVLVRLPVHVINSSDDPACVYRPGAGRVRRDGAGSPPRLGGPGGPGGLGGLGGLGELSGPGGLGELSGLG
jgi:hypothetical protein